MENIYNHYGTLLQEVLLGQGYQAADLQGIRLAPPREAAHGDMATNAALILGNRQKKNPREIAARLAAELGQQAGIKKAEVAGAGFINFFLEDEVWQGLVKVILEKGAAYGKSTLGRGVKVNIEYVSANPTGPLHIGHARGAIFGDCLAALMENAGYEVVREYYVNDEGAQIDALARSLLLRMEGKPIAKGQNLYPGEYVVEIAETMDKAMLDLPPAQRHQKLREEGVKANMAMIKRELAQLNIRHDTFSYESALHKKNAIDTVLTFLQSKDLVYQGRLPAPKGVAEKEWKAEEQLLFKSSLFGDDSDRTIKKASGDWTYFAGDMAYHYDKIQRGFDILVNVFGSDHSGYVSRLSAVVQALSDKKARLEVCLMHLVRVVRAGKAEMMSKRDGNFISLQELLDEIGADALRFIMLTRKHDAPLDIDVAQLKELSNDNPVFYVQYAHARCCSVLAQAEGGGALDGGGLTPSVLAALSNPAELALLRLLGLFPKEVEDAARDKTPHRLAFYLLALAGQFHALWNRGNEDESFKFIVKSATIKLARLALVTATQQTLSRGLNLMGIKPIKELR